MPQLTEWLKLMLSEIDRKRDDAERAREEDARRDGEQVGPDESAGKNAQHSRP